MRSMRTLAMIGTLGLGLSEASEAQADDDFARIQSKAEFVKAIDGKELSILRPFYLRNAIKLQVSPGGQISGKALNKPVTGAWRWENGLFCREMTFGDDDIGSNCQVVAVNNDQIRFIADRGRGDRADFRLQP